MHSSQSESICQQLKMGVKAAEVIRRKTTAGRRGGEVWGGVRPLLTRSVEHHENGPLLSLQELPEVLEKRAGEGNDSGRGFNNSLSKRRSTTHTHTSLEEHF